jgi:hypothetical protein
VTVVMMTSALLNLSVCRLGAGEIPGLQCATQGCEGILLAASR